MTSAQPRRERTQTSISTMSGNRIETALLIVGCLCGAISCNGTWDIVPAGQEVKFSGYSEGVESTKASYAGDSYTEEGKNYESIHWTSDDIVRIYCKNGATTEIEVAGTTGIPDKYVADYRVNEVASDGTTSKIRLNAETTPIGIRWNEDENVVHDFYAVYPSPSCTYHITSSINGKAISCNLASEQNTLSGAVSGTGGNYTLAPDMRWMLMYGYSKGYKRSTFPSGSQVFIKFKPLTTAIQFTITNSVSSSLIIRELDLISNGTQIFGKFNVPDVETLSADGYPAATFETGYSDNRTVSLQFASPYVTIAKDKTFTFTFFLAPVSDLDDLKFRIVRSDGTTMTTRLGYTDGTGVKFPRCKKSYVTGIMVPEGVQWTIDYEPVLTDWVSGGDDTPVILD